MSFLFLFSVHLVNDFYFAGIIEIHIHPAHLISLYSYQYDKRKEV